MKILNFGALNIDLVYSVEDFVRPGETIAALKQEKFFGGKAQNQAIAVAKGGGHSYIAGKIGNDGKDIIENLKNYGVVTDFVKVDENASTGNAIIQVNNNGNNCIILSAGANNEIDHRFIDNTLDFFQKGDIISLQNEINNLSYIIEKAYEKGMRVALNPSPANDNINSLPLSKVEWFIINEIEGGILTGKQEKEEICSTLLQKYPNSKVLLTLGANGSYYCDGEYANYCPIYPTTVVDTTAAGDTYAAYFLTAICENMTVKSAMDLASKASSITVSKKGASNSIPKRYEVENL